MSAWLNAVVSLTALSIGAGVAIAGAVQKENALLQLGCTICGGALGMLVPSQRAPHQPPQPRRRDTSRTVVTDKE